MNKLIHFRLYANMRTITGRSNLEISFSDAKSLREIIDYLIELHPDVQDNVLDEHENLRQDVPIFVNGRNPRLNSSGINTTLEAGDVISLFSPISSGRMNVEVMRTPGTDKEQEIR